MLTFTGFCFRISSVKYDILMLHDHGDNIVKFQSGKKVFSFSMVNLTVVVISKNIFDRL